MVSLRDRLAALERALDKLEEALREAMERRGKWEYEFFRDSAIQRFEFTFELFWKTLQKFLEKEGKACRSPRSCIREFFTSGYLDEEETRELLEMVLSRNLTTHTYQEETAEAVFRHLPRYAELMRRGLNRIREVEGEPPAQSKH